MVTALALAACGPATGDDVRFSDAWMRAAPPTANVLAGYFVVENPGEAPRSVTGVTSPVAARVEIHETVEIDGLARMRSLETIDIPPGERVALEPGGMHLMFMGPVRVPAAGETVSVVLVFADGSTRELLLEVRTGSADSDNDTRSEP